MQAAGASRPDAPQTEARRPLLVLYDPDCGVCSHSVRVLRVLDRGGRLDIVPLTAGALIPGAPALEDLRRELHVRDRDGRWHRGGRAIARICRALPVLVPLGIVAELPLADGLVDRAYRVVAAHRTRLSRLLGVEACRLDEPVSTASRLD